MKHSLTVCLITSRPEPKFEWLFDSLRPQIQQDEHINLIVVDLFADTRQPLPHNSLDVFAEVKWTEPKPTVWQGKHRLTKENWWAASNARNTGICLCQTEWMAFLDDRCVLEPTWLQSVRHAMDGDYAVAGSYEKVHNMIVENGLIKSFVEPVDGGRKTGKDSRLGQGNDLRNTYGADWYGCNTALPLEWALTVNGYDESCDSLGYEDCQFGKMLVQNNFITKFDPKMKMVEDRTMPDSAMTIKRTDKGISPNDKSHAIDKRTDGKKQATHHWNLREIREKVLSGEPFPIPTEPTHDWYDGMKIQDFDNLT